MATNLEIAGAVKRTQKGDADWYYGGDNEAWPDMATALASIPASVRPGKTIGIFAATTIVEYWWPTEAVADVNLVPKTPDLSAYATTSYVDSALIPATESTAGITKIATQAAIQTETTVNDTDTITPKKFWQGIARYAALAFTIVGDRIFNGLLSIVKNVPELRFITPDSAYARFQRTTISNNNQFVGKNDVLQVGGIGKALDFNAGMNTYFTMSDTGFPSNFPTAAFTISFWIKTGSTALQSIMNWGGTGEDNAGIYMSSGSVGFYVNTGARGASYYVADNKWHNIIIVFGASYTSLYGDGNLIGTAGVGNTLTLTGSIDNYHIGGNIAYGSYTLDQLLTYNRVLSTTSGTFNIPNEIAQIYYSGGGTATPPLNGLTNRFEFENGTGNISSNLVGTDMLLFNNPIWNNVGIVPISASSSENQFFSITDGILNTERGIAAWGDFNGRNQQVGKWFQFYQNGNYPLASNNYGQFRFDSNNSSSTVPIIASTIDIAGNVTIGDNFAGTQIAPINGLLVQGNVLLGDLTDNTFDKLQIKGNIILTEQGNKLKIATGNNASLGSNALLNGNITINTTAVTADSIIIYSVKTAIGTQGFLSQGITIIGSSFSINSSSATDNSLINWWIIN